MASAANTDSLSQAANSTESPPTANNGPRVVVNNVSQDTIGEQSNPSGGIVMKQMESMKDNVVTPRVKTSPKHKIYTSISTNKDRDHIIKEKESGVKSQITRTLPANVPEAEEVTPSMVAGEGIGIQPVFDNNHEQHAVPVPSSHSTSEGLVVVETTSDEIGMQTESVDLSNTEDIANNNAQSDLQVTFGENDSPEEILAPVYSVEPSYESVLVENDHGVVVGDDLQYLIGLPDIPTAGDDVKEQTSEIENDVGGCAFKLCNIKRLKRYLVIGSENGTYYCSTPKHGWQNIKCVKDLIKRGCYKKVLETVAEYSKCSRVVKEDPVLTVLALCTEHDFHGIDEVQRLEVRKCAYDKVFEICNIPTKLFRFLDLTQDEITHKRKTNPPIAQRNKSIKPKKHHKQPSVSSENEPNKVQAEFKKVHQDGRRSLGWGRLRRKCVAKVYTEENDATHLLYLLTKYRSRYNFSQKLVIRWAHPKMVGDNKTAKNLVLRYITSGIKKVQKEWEELPLPIDEETSEVIGYIKAIEEVKLLSPENPADVERLLNILKEYGERNVPKKYARCFALSCSQPENNVDGEKGSIHIIREHIPTEFLRNPEVWEALLCDMPMTALIRSLGCISSKGLFDGAYAHNVGKVVYCLKNRHKLKTARIHPMKILTAKIVYESGQGEEGKLKWEPNQEIVNALEEAYYLSFKQAEGADETFKTGKKFMLCLSLSKAMSKRGGYGCKTMSSAMAAAAMAWLTWNIEGEIELVGCRGDDVQDMKTLGFTKEMPIKEVLDRISTMNFGATDCSLPMTYALEKRLEIDVFVIYCDSQPHFLANKPKDELLKYNTQMNRCAKLIVCGMESTNFTFADPLDPNMLDIVGFDTHVPEVICAFSSDEINGLCGDECHECHPRDER